MTDSSPTAAREKRRPRRVLTIAGLSALIGGLLAGGAYFLLHAHPAEAWPAAPVFLWILATGGGDLDAIIKLLVGGFVLYGLYGLVLAVPKTGRFRVIAFGVLAVVHLVSAVLCELIRIGRL